MNIPKDLHICGTCKKIFNNINIFLEHKSKCLHFENNSVNLFIPSTLDNSLENGLFANQTILDLTVFEHGSSPLLLQYDNEEEVISDNNLIQSQEDNSTQDRLNEILPSSQDVDDDDINVVSATQLSKRYINKSLKSQRNQLPDERSEEISNLNKLNSTEYLAEENEPSEEELQETALNQNKKNVCKLCSFVAVYRRDLVRHMRKHTGERPYTCCICGKKFARQDKLVTHQRIHSGDKRYKCELCEYATTDSGALRKHLRIHTDDRPHKCQMCSYRARNTSHMTVHLRTHTGDSPFFCQLETCGRAFKTSTDLKRHMKVHKLESFSPTYSPFEDVPEKFSCKHLSKYGKLMDKSSSCSHCQDYTHKRVSRRRGSSRGRRGVQVLCVKTQECPHCSAAFVRQDSLRSHLKQHQQSCPPVDVDEPSVLDGEEPEKENDLVISHSSGVGSPSSAVIERCHELLFESNSNCLQDSLDHDGAGHYIMDNSFL